MASISASVELYDRMSAPLMSIMNAMNMTISSMRDMQSTMGSDMDTSSLDAATQAANQAQAAMEALNQSMHTGSQTPGTGGSEPTPTPSTDPVQIPVEWVTNDLDVFSNTGIDRFQQEVASTNQMLTTLSDRQSQIATQAAGTEIFSDSAMRDINSMGQRIQAVQQRIQQIENNPVNLGTDTANAELEELRGQLNQALQAQEALNQAVQNMDVSAANSAYNQLSSTVANTERYIRDNADAQGNLNQQIQAGVNTSNELVNTVKRLAATYLSMQGIKKVIDVSDELTMTTARLNTMNQAFNTINETATETDTIVKQIYASAQNARGSFGDMAAVVAKFGNNARDAFASQDEVIAFANLVQKQMTIAGASTQEASNAMLQLSQALGSGVLRGDELNSIFEQAPNLIQSIADYLDVPIGKIREMASEGELSADVVKAAIFSSAEDINAKFKAMPMTWGQIWQSMQNIALIAFQPVLQRLNDIANSQAFQTFVNSAIEYLAVLANMVLNVFDFLASCGQFVADNWSIIEPIVYGVVAALAVYATYLGIVKGIEMASAAATVIHSVAMSAKIGIMAALTGQTMAATAAQMGYNGALYACPIVWIIMLVITLIAVIVMLCNWIAEATGAANSGIGIIVGALSVAVAFIGNIFVALINMVIDIFVVLWNFITAFVNFFGNVFTDPVGAIARLFFDLVDCILGLLQTLAGAIDALFGSNLSGAVQGWRDELGGWVDSTFGKGEEIMATVSGEEWHVDRFEYGEAWDAGVAVGDGISSAIDNFSLSDLFGSTDIPDVQDYTSQFTGLTDSLDGISTDTGNISDAMEITDEDLKYLRDIAETEAINRFTTAEIQVTMNNNNTVSGDMDIDGMVDTLSAGVLEAMEQAAEGVH